MVVLAAESVGAPIRLLSFLPGLVPVLVNTGMALVETLDGSVGSGRCFQPGHGDFHEPPDGLAGLQPGSCLQGVEAVTCKLVRGDVAAEDACLCSLTQQFCQEIVEVLLDMVTSCPWYVAVPPRPRRGGSAKSWRRCPGPPQAAVWFLRGEG